MGTSILKKAASFLRKKGKYAAVLACVLAVFAAGYRMVLPGFTLERELVCGLEEHVHTEACFPPPKADTNEGTDGTSESGKPEGDSQPGLGIGTENGTEKVLACPFEGKEAHTHNAECYEVGKILICGQEEAETESHIHTEDCYTITRELSCGQEEAEGHVHDASCYQAETKQTCGQEEAAGHTHGDGCYDENAGLVCGQEEVAGHSHSEACYSSEDKLVCGQEEMAGHTHEEGCYTETKELTCGKEETGEPEKHTHTDSCYQEDNKLVCGKEEYAPEMHVHGEGCYIEKPAAGAGENGTAGDGMQEGGNGAAGDGTQGEENQEYQPICGLEEHTHTDACYGEEIMAVEDNIVASGEWWQLDNEGLLTITATESVTEIPDGTPLWANNSKDIKSVRIEGMKKIGKNAFSNHIYLSSVSISGNLEIIDERAFWSCSSLTEVNIPDSLKIIEKEAFYYCRALANITIPENTETIGEKAFGNCSSLVNITIPENTKTIGREAFQYCEKLGYIELPDSVTEIGKGAFRQCTNLVGIKLPEGLKEIKEETFSTCTRLASINIPEGVTRIGYSAFINCYNLASLSLPKGLVEIEDYAFQRCEALAEIELPEGLESVSGRAFSGCESVSSLTIRAKNLAIKDYSSNFRLPNIRQVKICCESVDVLRKEILEIWKNADVTFEGPGCFAMESSLTLGYPMRKELAAGQYYADEGGALYLLQDGTASLAHVPAGIKEYTVRNHIPPMEDGQKGWTVVSVEKDALKMADGLESLWFENPADIVALPDYSCGNCPSLSSVNGKGSISEVRLLFTEETAFGKLAFYNTGLESGSLPGLDNSSITLTVGGIQVLSMSTRKMNGEEDGALELYTGENAATTISLSGQLNQTDYTVARVYFSFENEDGRTQYGSAGSANGNYDFTLEDGGISYTIKARKSDEPFTYYYEIPRSEAGGTIKLRDIPSWYPSPSSKGGSVRIWPVLLTEADKEAVGNGVVATEGRYHQASWKTKADTFPVVKIADEGTMLKGGREGDGSLYINSLSYSIAMSREGDTLEAMGKDYMRSADFEDTLLLPEGVEWRQELLEAVKTGNSYWKSSKIEQDLDKYTEEYYANIGNASYLLFRIEHKRINGGGNILVRQEPSIIEEDGKKSLKIRWGIKNSSTEEEMLDMECKLYVGDEAILVNLPGDGESQEMDLHIVNEVKSVQHFTHSKDQISSTLAETDVQVSEGKCEIKKTSNFSEKSSNFRTWGMDYDYTVSLENSGSLPYKGIDRVWDTLSRYLYIRPSYMEKMVREADGMAGVVDRLEITISDAVLCETASAGGQGYYPGKQVTGTDGKIYTLTQQDTGIGTEYEAGKNVGTDNAQKENGVEISVIWERGKDGVVLSYPGGEKEINNIGDLGRELESIGYVVTASSTYSVSWELDEKFELHSGAGKNFSIPVTVKNSFMLLEQDVLEKHGNYNFSLESNTVYWAKAAGEDGLPYVYKHEGSDIKVRRDYTLQKEVRIGGNVMDTENDTVVAGDVLTYGLEVTYTTREVAARGIVPLVDRMRGAQALLVPTDKNDVLEGSSLEKMVVDGEEYYMLDKKGVYEGVTLGGSLTDSITVTEEENGELDTMIRWYLADINLQDTDANQQRNKNLSYKAYVMPSLGEEDGTFRLSNESWLNDHQSHRLYDQVGLLGTNAVIEKMIVLSQGESKKPSEDVLAEYSPVYEGASTTYRLMIENSGLGRVIEGSQIYDILPETWGFQWSKENVKIEYYDAGDGAYKLTGGEDWEIEKNGKEQRIVWGDKFRLELEKTIYIYVTLEWPKGEIWEGYARQYGAKRLENTFWCYKLWDRVSHDLAAGTKAYLQKGVYYTNDNRELLTDEENRLYYTNVDASGKHSVVYYTYIYNGGNTRLYLSELQDRIPEGFTVGKTSLSNKKPSTITDADGNKVMFKALSISSSGDCINNLGDGRISIELKGWGDSKDYIQYDALHGKWYLAPGEAIGFTYTCYPGEYASTDDIAVNCITMPYYDVAGKLEVADIKAEGPVYSSKEVALKNDGGCYLMTTEEAERKGFDGGGIDTQWLTSEVKVRRGNIIPGITKKVASITSGGQVMPPGGSANAADTISWEVTATNSGKEALLDYTLTDVMEMPYGFIGPVKYTVEKQLRGDFIKVMSVELFSVNSCTKSDGKITLNLALNRGSFITDNWYLDGKLIANRQVDLQEGSVVSVVRKYKSGEALEYDISLLGGSEEKMELMIRCKNKDMGIPPGGRGILALSTKNITGQFKSKAYTNQCYITPEMQQYDGDLVSQGNQTEHNGKPSVQNSARIQVSYGHTTTSEKRVEEIGNSENKASSNEERNYILLEDVGKKFRYTLTVGNTNKEAMEKLILIDSLPQVGDHNPFTEAESRFSGFRVNLAETPEFEVWIRKKGEEAPILLDEKQYRLEFSRETKFKDEDWKGESTEIWRSSISDIGVSEVRSFRIVIQGEGEKEGGDLIPAGASVDVKFTGQIDSGNSDEPLMPGKTAWNGFGYRYKLNGSEDELESTPLNVGVRLPDVPRLVKKLEDEEGNPVSAAEDMAFRFLVYQGNRLPLKENFTEEELAEALRENSREFTCVEALVKSGSSQSETLVLTDLKKWEYQSGAVSEEEPSKENLIEAMEDFGGWRPTEEAWVWKENEKYTVVELPLGEEEIYQFNSLGGLENNGYTFTHSGNHGKKIVAINACVVSATNELPETGGVGIHGYMLAGCLCLAAAGMAFGRKRQGRTGSHGNPLA